MKIESKFERRLECEEAILSAAHIRPILSAGAVKRELRQNFKSYLLIYPSGDDHQVLQLRQGHHPYSKLHPHLIRSLHSLQIVSPV